MQAPQATGTTTGTARWQDGLEVLTEEQVRKMIGAAFAETDPAFASFSTVLDAVAQVVKTMSAVSMLDGIPSGHLYAQLMDLIDVQTYMGIIELLERAGVIVNENHLLKWVINA